MQSSNKTTIRCMQTISLSSNSQHAENRAIAGSLSLNRSYLDLSEGNFLVLSLSALWQSSDWSWISIDKARNSPSWLMKFQAQML